jgi:site-specific DNA-methyltransferase (adenine-specific)
MLYERFAGLDNKFRAQQIGWATLIQAECLEAMKHLPTGSVDMVLCDLPYGTTACKWDVVIPFEPLWAEYRRVAKPNAAIVLTATQPFTSALVMSNPKMFRHEWVWDKDKAGNFANAKRAPLRATEDVLVFSKEPPTYYPQMVAAEDKNKRPRDRAYAAKGDITQGMASGLFKVSETHNEELRYPKNILRIKSTEGECNNLNRVHPTQKPVALMEYLIRTYTNKGEVVLDNTMGSGTTGVACINTGRRFIGIEREANYYEVACSRVSEADEL